MVVKIQPNVYRNSPDNIFFCWKDFGATFENQITFAGLEPKLI